MKTCLRSLSSPFSLIISIFNVVLCTAEIKNKIFQYFYRYAWWKCPWFSKSSQIKICYPSRGLATHFCFVSPFQILGVYGLKSDEWKIDLLADEKWFLREYCYNPCWLYKQGNIFMSSVSQWYCLQSATRFPSQKDTLCEFIAILRMSKCRAVGTRLLCVFQVDCANRTGEPMIRNLHRSPIIIPRRCSNARANKSSEYDWDNRFRS